MYSVLIVDDEQIIRNSIHSMIRRMDNHKIGGVYSCGSADEAVRFCSSNHPDIVITDIVMGERSGIDLLSALNTMLNGTHYLVISGYDDYQYVRSAFNEGAVDYLLKPVLYPEFKGIMDRICASLDEKQITAFNSVFQQFILSLSSEGDQTGAGIRFRDCGPDHICDIAIISYPLNDDKTIEREYRQLSRSMFSDAEFVSCRQGSCVYLMIMTPESHADLPNALKREVIERSAPGMVPSIVADSCRMSGLRASFNRLLRCSAVRLRDGYGKVYVPNDEDDDASMLPGYFNAMTDLLKQDPAENPEYVGEQICELFRKAKASDLRSTYQAFTSIIRQYAYQRDSYTEMPSFPGFQSFIHDSELYDAIRSIVRGYTGSAGREYSGMIALIRRYIEDNYDHRLSLSELADHFSVSYAHLSHVFSTAMGMPFTEYLTLTRMKHARLLIYDPGYTVQEISVLCGYDNQYSFTRAFKRHYGISPTGYRKALEDTIIK